MNYCLAIDIAKSKSTFALFNSNVSSIVIEPVDIVHSLENLLSLHSNLIKFGISNISVILESTSTYHLPIVNFFKDRNYQVIVINPLISKEHKRTLRKTKTDKLDCFILADIYFKGDYNKQSSFDNKYEEMQYISRYLITLEHNLVRIKNRFRQLIGLTFPEYETIFNNNSLFDEINLNFIYHYPHAEIVSNKRIDALTNTLFSYYNRHYNYYANKAKFIKSMASNSLTSVSTDSIVCNQIKELALFIISEQKHLVELKQQLIDLCKDDKLFNVCLSFDGISYLTAAYLCAELKDISRFSSYKKLIASCGLDPTIIESGKSINYHGPISKRGNRISRKRLFNIIVNIVTVYSKHHIDNEFVIYYRKKRSEGKHHYAAIIACSTKLLRKIFYRFNDTSFCC